MADESNVLTIHTDRPDADVVGHIERLLERAKAGELTAFAFVALEKGVTTSGSPGHWPSWSELIGALSRLTHRTQLQMDVDIETVDITE